jgi:hypothetical protein
MAQSRKGRFLAEYALILVIAILVVTTLIFLPVPKSDSPTGQAVGNTLSNRLVKPDTCTDTDGGAKKEVRGIVSGLRNGKSYSKKDYCQDSNTVKEYVCKGNQMREFLMECEAGEVCKIGACVSNMTCVDSDGGVDYYVRGEVSGFASEPYLFNEKGLEGFEGLVVLSPTVATLKLFNETKDMALGGTYEFSSLTLRVEKIDFMGKDNPGNSIEVVIIKVVDTCSGNSLREFYCKPGSALPPAEFYECPYGCRDGACQPEPLPIAYWRFDEGQGNVVRDSADANHGTFYGENWEQICISGSCASFNGRDSYVQVMQHGEFLTLGDELTIEAWVNVRGGENAYRSVITRRDGGGGKPTEGWMLYAGLDNKWQFWLSDGHSGWTKIKTDAGVELNKWTYIAAIYSKGKASIYVNGEPKNSSEVPKTVLNSNRPLRIGAGVTESETAKLFFNGLIDEVKIYNSSLTAEEIKQNYETMKPTARNITCMDSDGGENYTVKGTATWGPIGGKMYNATDGCDYLGQTLLEHYCYYSENLSGWYNAVEYVNCTCVDGACQPLATENVKDPSLYLDKEVFLVSDKDWRNVLQLVPVTTWTDDSDWCNKGYGTPGDVCVYPTLIYHEEEGRNNFKVSEDIMGVGCPYGGECQKDIEVYLEEKELSMGEGADFLLGLTNSGENLQQVYLFIQHGKLIDIESEELDINCRSDGYCEITQNHKDISLNPQETKEYRLHITLRMGLGGFDADSIIYFMQQYNTDKVTIIGNTPNELDNLLIAEPELGAGLTTDKIQRISVDNLLDYWQSYENIVYVEDNYETALLASTYASLLNAPLIIQGEGLDKDEIFAGKNIICVGNVNRNCNENYNLEQLQKKYVELTNTDKIILVNSNDLDIEVEEQFQPEKSSNPIFELYGKTSLAAPILASAKQELILGTILKEYFEIDKFITNKVSILDINSKYLTILSSPWTIPMTKKDFVHKFQALDNDIYGDFDRDIVYSDWFPEYEISVQDLAVGRIFGLTISDASSMISRTIFYDKTLNTKDFAILVKEKEFPGMFVESIASKDLLTNAGYNDKSKIVEYPNSFDLPTDLENKFFINYYDHGWTKGVTGIETQYLDYYNVKLSNSIFIASACSTCAYDRAFSKSELFCANIIRRGAIAFVGAVDTSTDNYGFPGYTLLRDMANGSDIGTAFLNNKRAKLNFDNEIILISDPTFNLNIIDKRNDKFYIKSEIIEENKIKISLNQQENEKLNRYISYQGSEIISYSIPSGKNLYMYQKYKSSDQDYSWDRITYFIKLELPKNKIVKDITSVDYINKDGQIIETNFVQYSFRKSANYLIREYDNPLFSNYNNRNIEVLVRKNGKDYYLNIEEVSNEDIVSYSIPKYSYEIILELEES